jgi:hypothetical protein
MTGWKLITLFPEECVGKGTLILKSRRRHFTRGTFTLVSLLVGFAMVCNTSLRLRGRYNSFPNVLVNRYFFKWYNIANTPVAATISQS